MKRKLHIIIFAILIISLQMTTLEYTKIYNIKPNVLLVFLILVNLLSANTDALFCSVFCGLLQDVVSGKVFGIYILLNVYVYFMTSRMNKRNYRESIFLTMFMLLILSITYESIFLVLFYFPQSINNIQSIFMNTILIESVYNFVVAIGMYFILNKITVYPEKMFDY